MDLANVEIFSQAVSDILIYNTEYNTELIFVKD